MIALWLFMVLTSRDETIILELSMSDYAIDLSIVIICDLICFKPESTEFLAVLFIS